MSLYLTPFDDDVPEFTSRLTRCPKCDSTEIAVEAANEYPLYCECECGWRWKERW